MTKATKKAVVQAANRIRVDYPGSRIVLFGSAARETDSADSDIDMCVILDSPGDRVINVQREIRSSIYPLIRKPLDLLVYDNKVFEERAALPVTFEAEILEHGKFL